MNTYKGFKFWHMKNKEFSELWKIYKDTTEAFMTEIPIARISFKNVEIYIALEKEDGNEYITIFTTTCKNEEWQTEDFFNDEEARNNKIKKALEKSKWNNIQQIMFDLLMDYCEEKKIIAEEI